MKIDLINVAKLLSVLVPMIRRVRRIEATSWAGAGLIAASAAPMFGLSQEQADGLGMIFGGIAVLVPERRSAPAPGADSGEGGQP